MKQKVIDINVTNFKIINEKLYYVKNQDQCLYVLDLDGNDEQKLSDYAVRWYDQVDENIYYTVEDETEQEQYYLYKADTSGNDILILEEPIKKVQVANNKIVCWLQPEEDYGIKIFNKKGKLFLAVTDSISDVFVYKNKVLMTAEKSIRLLDMK